MTIPLSFLLGLAVLLIHDQLGEALPTFGSFISLAPWLLLIPVPWLLARLTLRKARNALIAGTSWERLRLVLQLQSYSVPFFYYLIMTDGGLPQFVTSLSLGSILAESLLLLAPLLIMESTLRVAERSIQATVANTALDTGVIIGLSRLRMAVFVTTPVLLFAGITDLVFLDRRLEVFLSVTSAGSTLGLALMVLFFCAVLPIMFRALMATTRRLPRHLADDLRQTASRLGFPATSVLAMDTGCRTVNAALVGPLPRPRYLVLTDGLLSILDANALRGVVAHEVGHARAGHPALLLLVFGALPLLSIQPLFLWFGESGAVQIAVLVGVGLALGWRVLRRLAHRFEYEADILSAEALGGAQPCIDALRRVGQLSPQSIHRASLRHPSEQQRIACLLGWEADPGFRARFKARGRRLRQWILAASGVVLVAAVWAQFALWPVDRAVYLFYTGDFPAARTQLAELSDRFPAQQEQLVDDLTAEADAALELLPNGGEWHAINGRLAEQAYERAVATLIREGPEAARPWFGLALTGDGYSPVHLSLYLYCNAAHDGDQERMRVLREHILQIGVDRDVAHALGV